VKLTLDLHDIYNRGSDIDRALRDIINEAVEKKAPLVEIIPGKGSGALKKRVLRFLDQKEIKALYHRVEKDSDNFGRILIHFRWKQTRGKRCPESSARRNALTRRLLGRLPARLLEWAFSCTARAPGCNGAVCRGRTASSSSCHGP